MPSRRARVVVVGSGPRFLSGISYYTHRLACALAQDHAVSVLLMRRLLPAGLYPGKERVGADLVSFRYPPDVAVHDGLDWTWGRSLLRSVRFLRRRRPEVVVFQWWTGTVLHSYLALAVVARLLGARVVLEMHEAQDVGELAVPLAGQYVKALFPLLVRLSAAMVVHSEFDRSLVEDHYGLTSDDVAVIPHGPYGPQGAPVLARSVEPAGREPDEPVRLLYFGVIRPFKGVEDLLGAFAGLSPAEAAGYRLTIAGETWEGWTRPAELVATHPHRDRITFVNRYLHDDEVTDLFARTDAVVLPYHRSSSSGPLQMAIGHGLPVLVSDVGGLREACSGYEGAVLVPPRDPGALRAALPVMAARAGLRYTPTASWETTRSRYEALFRRLGSAVPPVRSTGST